MRSNQSPPSGQALVEMLIVGLLLIGVLTILSSGQGWVEQRAQSAEAIRLQAEWCRQSAEHCQAEELRRVLPSGVKLTQLEVKTQHANATTLKAWAASLRGLASHGGQAVFGLPDGNPLSVLAAEIEGVSAHPSIQTGAETFRLAVIPHDWRSIQASEAEARISRGSEPSESIANAVSAAHSPSLGVLMPLTDLLGLDDHTQAIRSGFHRLEPLRPAQALGDLNP